MNDSVSNHPSVIRVRNRLKELSVAGEIKILEDSARSAREAADALAVEVGQICSSLIFACAGKPILVLTSGRHRVDTAKVASEQGLSALDRADAELVKNSTGFAIGGVAPIGHLRPITTYIDSALAEYPIIWAAAGHPHAVFPTTFDELLRITGARPIAVAVD
ncbi:MAG: YbaK/EbsC family protein [Actinobacteria bacterium]|nr:YbaK/EbsC family protein [Actinomycetota bacterium]